MNRLLKHGIRTLSACIPENHDVMRQATNETGNEARSTDCSRVEADPVNFIVPMLGFEPLEDQIVHVSFAGFRYGDRELFADCCRKSSR